MVIGYRLSVIGYWLLVIGYRLSVIGYWLLVIGYWLSVIGYRSYYTYHNDHNTNQFFLISNP